MKGTRTKSKPTKQLSLKTIREIKAKSSTNPKPNGGILILLFLLFVISVTLLVIGFMNSKKNNGLIETAVPDEIEHVENEESITNYFDDAFSKSSSGDAQDEVYLQDDPFKDQCASTSGDGVPAISFGTVCYR